MQLATVASSYKRTQVAVEHRFMLCELLIICFAVCRKIDAVIYL